MYSSLLQLENLCRILDSFAMEYEALFILLMDLCKSTAMKANPSL